MSNYVKSTNFAIKDSLVTTDPAKVIKGTDIDNEYNAIANAIASKADTNSPALTGTPSTPTANAGTNTTQIANTTFVTAALAALIPTGVITLWSGAIAAIPSGWVLCNGANSTPDLRDRFVVGAGTTYAVGATGGANTVTLDATMIPAHTHSISASGTTGNQSADHTHTFSGSGSANTSAAYTGIYDSGHTHSTPAYITNVNAGGGSPAAIGGSGYQPSGGSTTGGAAASIVDPTHYHSLSVTVSGTTAGMSANHTHSVTVTGTSGNGTGGGLAHENRPPYYALAYIMKT